MSMIETPPMHFQETPRRRTRRLLVVALFVVVAGLLYAAYWWSYDRFYVRTDNAYVTGNLVPIVAQATGIVTQVLAEETQFVNKGDLVIRLDEHQASAALGRARGHLGETVRRITALFGLDPARYRAL
jgi:membrane fusion protein, multidrug efflux system